MTDVDSDQLVWQRNIQRFLMTATSALEKIETIIDVAYQRLNPQALQRLTIEDILGEDTTWRATSLVLPTKDEVGATAPHLETAYNRIAKFLRLHEPTGTEKDVVHKRDAVRYLALSRMIRECIQAKLPNIKAACVERIVQWFDVTSDMAGSFNGVGFASTTALPPRMSPKKPVSGMTKSYSQEALASNASVDAMKQTVVSQKLGQYKMPDLRASHIRRIAQLRARGEDIDENDIILASEDDIGTGEGDPMESILEPEDYVERDKRAKIKSTFNVYEPETDAEFVMNQMWLERKHEQDQEKKKEQEVRGKLRSWSMNKSRDESEYLRKQEAMQLAAGLEKLVDEDLLALEQPRHRALQKKREEWQTLQQSAPAPFVVQSGGATIPAQLSLETDGRSARGPTVMLKKKKSGGGPSTPVGSGGMHFRNQLPANYTPQSKRSSSNGTPTTFSSRDSKSTPSTPLSTSSSGQLMLLDEAAERLGESYYAIRSHDRKLTDSPEISEIAPTTHEHEPDGRVETHYHSGLTFSERVQDTRQKLKFQPFHPVTQTQQGSLPLARAVSAPAISRKLFPRGTIPPQAEPLDPEYRHIYVAMASRKPPLPPSLIPEKVTGPARNSSSHKVGFPMNNQSETLVSKTRQNLQSVPGSKKAPAEGGGASTLLSVSSTDKLLSDLRTEQMVEMERIRILFERHKIGLPKEILERGLLIPEDNSTLECVRNLPLPGDFLTPNPLLQGKGKATKPSKKKKSKKGGKGKKKSKKTPGDKSKSPKKKTKK